jgi:hypothetical protein
VIASPSLHSTRPPPSPPLSGPWRRVLPHPLADRPLEALSDDEADLYCDTMASVGWTRYSPAIQGRNAEGARVICVAYIREEGQP